MDFMYFKSKKHQKDLWLGQSCCGVPNHWRIFWRIIPVCKFSWVTALKRSKKLPCNTKGQLYFSLKVYKPTESFLFQLWISACYLISRDFRSCMPLVRKVLVPFLGDCLIRNCRNRAILLVDISFKLYSWGNFFYNEIKVKLVFGFTMWPQAIVDESRRALRTFFSGIFNNYSSSPNGLWVFSPWGRRPNELLTQRPLGRDI